MGVINTLWFLPFFVGSIAITLYAIMGKSETATRISLVLASVALAVTISDLGLRLVVRGELLENWPRMPRIIRYVPNLNYQGYRFNDLSRMAGVKDWQEDKYVRVITDSAGFRNETLDHSRPLDGILLGDSFGAGAVSQEYTFTSILSQEYGINLYNLATPASGPWAEYINLSVEKDRLNPRPGTHLIWQLFTGNDLDDNYGPLQLEDLPWRGTIGVWRSRIGTIRIRSPIHRFTTSPDNSRDVIARDFSNGRKLLFYKPYIEALSRSPDQVMNHPNFASFRETIRSVKRFAASQGLRLSIVLLPCKEEVYSWVWKGQAPWSSDVGPSGFGTVLGDICAEEKLRCLDLKPDLVRESRRQYEGAGQILYWYDDTHMNVVGNKFTTFLIYDELIRKPAALP